MRQLLSIPGLLVALACASTLPGSPAEFPFPVSLPSSVTTIGTVNHERSGQHEFQLKDRTEPARGEKWIGHVRVNGAAPGDPALLAGLEQALITSTGWEAVYRDEKRTPPIATLRRTRGGELLWITLEGWADDVTVTVVHKR
ncbi:MAG: hypothetical protein WCQ64_00605 [Acidobacteriota bacterium]